jgi:hypothetical protein
VQHQRAIKPACWMYAPRQLDIIDWLEVCPAPMPAEMALAWLGARP